MPAHQKARLVTDDIIRNDGDDPIMIHGTYRSGRIELDEQVDWADGVRVAVTPSDNGVGLHEGDGPESDDSLADLLSRIDAIEPLELTPAEERDITEFHRTVREAGRDAVRRRMESSE
jgi:hypothetical protein